MPTKKIALVVGAAVMLLVAWRLGVFEVLRDPAHLKQALLDLGPVGFLAFVLAFGIVQPFALPGVMFIVAASLVWPPPVAISLSMAGAMLASVNGFAFSRYVARDWVEARISPRLRKYDERLATHGFATVFVLRLVFWTNQGVSALFGLSRVRFSTHLVATFLAYIPVVIAVTYLGGAFFDVVWRWLV